MKPGEWMAKLGRLQQTLMFKIIASVVVIAVAIGIIISYAAAQKHAMGDSRLDETLPAELAPAEPKPGEGAKADEEIKKDLADTYRSQVRFFNRLMDQKFDTSTVSIGVAVAMVPVLAAVWLGVGLTLFGYLVLGALICYPLLRFGNEFWKGIGAYTAGVLVLGLSFSTLVQAVRLSLSASHPITAIARNVLAEAVRMKVSLVFIVILILGLAALPGLLEPNTPLRYRVQSFMQYGATGSFWITAVLVLFLSAATVAFEQRDKIIWQTMTKPVRAWQYILGKWLGVVGIAAVLLSVSCTGVFLFTEYLRRTQTAIDEVAPYVSAKGPDAISEDRLMLETQVMVGRRSVRPALPADLGTIIDQSFAEKMKEAAKLYNDDPRSYEAPNERKIRKQVETDLLGEFLSVAPGGERMYEFVGLADARNYSVPLTLRYKVNSGSNDPTQFFTISLFIEESGPLIRSVPLGQVLTMPLSNAAVRHRVEQRGLAADTVRLTVINGDISRRTHNGQTISFAPDGLQISYTVSSFQENFLRVAIVMWLKLAFISMIALTASTFLAFPVACLVSFGSFLLAEASGFLTQSLEYFNPDEDAAGATKVGYSVIEAVGRTVTGLFRFYGELSPMADLVEGKVVSWGTVGYAVAVLGGLCVVFWVVASMIFRNRELATYSGQ